MNSLAVDDLFFLADFALGNGDNQTSIKYMNEALKKATEFNDFLYDLFIAPYRTIVHDLQDRLKGVSIELASEEIESEEQAHALEILKEDYTKQIYENCKTVIDTIQSKFIGSAEEIEQPKLHLFIGDFARYLSQLDISDATKYADLSHESYDVTLTAASELLPAAHPFRLNAANNLSILLYDVFDKVDDACELTQAIYNECYGNYDDLEEEDTQQAQEILETMRNNFVEWSGAEIDQ